MRARFGIAVAVAVAVSVAGVVGIGGMFAVFFRVE